MSARVLKYSLIRNRPDSGAATALLSGQPVPKWAKDLVEADDLVDADQADSGEAKGYADQTNDELKAEIDRRNEGREDDQKLAKAGKKDDLVAVLEADDAS